MQKITPFLWFNRDAEAAARFYTSIFKDSKILSMSPGPDGSPMVVNFRLEGQELIALNGGPQFKFTEAVSFVINCRTQQEIDYYWSSLTAGGGEESMCGWLKDKFGLSWQVVPVQLPTLLSDKDPKRAGAVMQAMLQMRKLDIAALERAHQES